MSARAAVQEGKAERMMRDHILLQQSRGANAAEMNWVGQHLRDRNSRGGRPRAQQDPWDTRVLHRPSCAFVNYNTLFSFTCLYLSVLRKMWGTSKHIQNRNTRIKIRTRKGALCILSYWTLMTTPLHRRCYLQLRKLGLQTIQSLASGLIVTKWHLDLNPGQKFKLSPLHHATYNFWLPLCGRSLPQQQADSSGDWTLKPHCWVQAFTPPLTCWGNLRQVT